MPRMKRAICLCLVALWMVPAMVLAGLEDQISVVLRDKLLAKADSGIVIIKMGQTREACQVVYKLDSEIPRIPASNLKLVTTSAFLNTMGGDFRFKTTVLLKGDDLVIWGDGDPTMGDSTLLKKFGWTTTTAFEKWADDLKSRGVTQIRNVIIDDSIFDQEFVHPNWPADQQDLWYLAGVGGLNLNTNCLDVTAIPKGRGLVGLALDPPTQYATIRNSCVAGANNTVGFTRTPGTNDIEVRGQAVTATTVSVTIADPPMYMGTVVAETLAKKGISFTGKVVRDRTDQQQYLAANAEGRKAWTVVTGHLTDLSSVLARTNQDSMNMYAEALCKRLGHEISKQPGSWANGTAAMGQYLQKLGIPAEQYHFDDGCGLSRKNLISPMALTTVLLSDYYGKYQENFLQSLSIAGKYGTLSSRFRGSTLRERVFGKSGYIDGVSSLSGFVKAKNGQWYAFSILMNGIPNGSNSSIKILQEKIVEAVDKE